MLLRIYERLVKAGLRFEMALRADAGFSSPELYQTCETLGVRYVIGLITHRSLVERLEPAMKRARTIAEVDGTAKVITDFTMRCGAQLSRGTPGYVAA